MYTPTLKPVHSLLVLIPVQMVSILSEYLNEAIIIRLTAGQTAGQRERGREGGRERGGRERE